VVAPPRGGVHVGTFGLNKSDIPYQDQSQQPEARLKVCSRVLWVRGSGGGGGGGYSWVVVAQALLSGRPFKGGFCHRRVCGSRRRGRGSRNRRSWASVARELLASSGPL
jgi:hypothetical protein